MNEKELRKKQKITRNIVFLTKGMKGFTKGMKTHISLQNLKR